MVVTHPLAQVEAARPRHEPRLAALLPREHGSWALALEPVVLAMIAAPSWRGGALALAVVALFLMRRPWQVLLAAGDPIRTSLAGRVFVGLALASTLLSAVAIGRDAGRLMVPLVVAAIGVGVFAWFDRQREARAAIAECTGAAAFAAIASAIVLLAWTRGGESQALAVGAFALARAWTSILPVRFYVRRRKGQAASAAAALVIAGGAVVCALATIDLVGTWVPAAWVVVFALRAGWLVSRWAPSWPARRIGWMEAALGLTACVTTGISFL